MINMESAQTVDILSLNPQTSISQTLKCESSNLAYNVCLNANCAQYVFLCNQKTCECYKAHKGCIKGSIQSITEALNEKILSIEPLQNRINDLIQDAINELSDYRDKILEKTKQELDYIGLTENEKSFMKAIKRNEVNGLTGKEMSEIFSCINNTKGFSEKMEKVEHRINQAWQILKRSMSISFSRIQTCLGLFSQKSSFHFFESFIIKTNDDKKNILNFFDKKITFSTLLYRASENDFEVETFYQNCKGINNTLVICETEYGKVIGGYTPLIWKIYSNEYYPGDSSSESFVFSLTNNDKFTLQSKSYALRYRQNFGPMFGNCNGTDFFIANHANKVKDSGANLNNGYSNSGYIRNDKSSWQKFSGSSDDFRFYVKEWEVWHLNFE